MTATQNLRRRAVLAPHTYLTGSPTSRPVEDITNIVWKATGDEDTWIEEATQQIGEWRSLARSVYLRWAITINACELAIDRYRDFPKDKSLQTKTLRMQDGDPQQAILAVWPGADAARHYEATTLLIAAYGVSDLYGAIEDILFEFAEIFYRHHPKDLIQGKEPEDRMIRKLWYNRADSDTAAAAWLDAWQARYDKWRRRKIYDGLPRLLRSVFRAADLKRPSNYHQTDIDTWAGTLEMIALLRHHVTHGAPTVSKELADLSGGPTSLTFDFVAGQPLDVKLHHLQSVECFVDQLLSALNISLLEKANGGPLVPKEATMTF